MTKDEEAYEAQPHIRALRAQQAREQAVDTAKHMKSFRAAAKKVERDIQKYASAEVDDWKVARRGIDGLYARQNKAEIRGDAAANAEADAAIAALMATFRAAGPEHQAARQR